MKLRIACACTLLTFGLAACGGAGREPVARSIETIGAHPDITVDKVAGGKLTPQQEAAIAMERTKNPGPGADLQPLHAADFSKPVAEYRVLLGGRGEGGAAPGGEAAGRAGGGRRGGGEARLVGCLRPLPAARRRLRGARPAR